MSVTRNQEIVRQIARLKMAITSHAALRSKSGSSVEALEGALGEAERAVTALQELFSSDHVFSKDPVLVDLPKYYAKLLAHARSSSSIAAEVIEYLAEDEKVFSQDFEDALTYRKMLKDLTDRRM